MIMYRRRDDWVGTQVEDSFVMINLDSGRYVALNETAAEAWALLEEPLDRQALAEKLTRRFAIDEAACVQSVGRLIDRMCGLDLIAEVP